MIKQSIFYHPCVRIVTSERQDGSMKKNRKFERNNLRQFLEKNHIESTLITMDQVHGNQVVVVSETDETIIPETDAIVTLRNDISLGVVTADCLPVFFYDPKNNVIAVVHAGYRGLFQEIFFNVMGVLSELGSRPQEVLVGIGPSIGVCCYSVDEKRADNFKKKFGSQYIVDSSGKQFLDLKALASDQLLGLGVHKEGIAILPLCTECQNDKYFSYRADTNETFGEMISVIEFV